MGMGFPGALGQKIGLTSALLLQLGSLGLGKVTRDYRRKQDIVKKTLFCADAIWLPR